MLDNLNEYLVTNSRPGDLQESYHNVLKVLHFQQIRTKPNVTKIKRKLIELANIIDDTQVYDRAILEKEYKLWEELAGMAEEALCYKKNVNKHSCEFAHIWEQYCDFLVMTPMGYLTSEKLKRGISVFMLIISIILPEVHPNPTF